MSECSPTTSCSPEPSPALIKTEPEEQVGREFDHEVTVERIKSEAEQLLYADHEIKEEMVIGPTDLHGPVREPRLATKGIDIDGGRLFHCRVELNDARDELQCTQCGHWSLTAAGLQLHKQTHAVKVYQGQKNGIDIDSGRLMHCRVELNDARKELQCIQCGHWSLTVAVLQLHKQTHAVKVYQGQKNGIDIDSGRLMHCRVELNDARKELQCIQCGHWSLTVAVLQLHKQTHAVKVYQCQKKHRIQPRQDKKHALKRRVQTNRKKDPPNCHKLRKRKQFKGSGKMEEPLLVESEEKKIDHQQALKPLKAIKKYKCAYCDYKFQCNSLLLKHQANHKNTKVFTCDICKKVFQCKISLRNHVNSHSSVAGEEQKHFDTKAQVRGLIDPRYSKPRFKKYTCDQCDGTYDSKNQLNIHQDALHNKMWTRCDICDITFRYNCDLASHLLTHGQVASIMACQFCNKMFTHRRSLFRHIYSAHKEMKAFACKSCDQKFSRKIQLKIHQCAHDEGKDGVVDEGKQYICNICYKIFTQKCYLTRHSTIHADRIKKFSCDLCQKKFHYKDSLVKHFRGIHSMKNDHRFLCHICGKNFKFRGNLSQHILYSHRRHSIMKNNFTCDICDKRYTFKSGLRKHLKSHSKTKTFVCKVCDKGFNQNSDYQRHLLIHDGIKAFKCDKCGRGFTFKGALTKHLKTVHSGTKHLFCDVCGFGFYDKITISKHLLIHSEIKSQMCDICGKTYYSEFCLTNHLKRHTKNLLVSASTVLTQCSSEF